MYHISSNSPRSPPNPRTHGTTQTPTPARKARRRFLPKQYPHHHRRHQQNPNCDNPTPTSMVPEESFHGMNPQRLAMLQETHSPRTHEYFRRGWAGSSGGRGRGRGRGGRFGMGAGAPYMNGYGRSGGAPNGVAKVELLGGEQLSGLDRRMEFKKNEERRATAVVPVAVGDGDGEQKKRKRGDEGVAAKPSESKMSFKRGRNGKVKDAIPNGVPVTDERGGDAAKEPIMNGNESPIAILEPKLSKKERKAAKAAKRVLKEAKKAAKEAKMGKEEREVTDLMTNGNQEGDDPKSKPTKSKSKTEKHKKDKRKRKAKELDSESPKTKKPKKSRKAETTEEPTSKWVAAAAELPGDDQRRSKFLRLLGAGAEAAAPTTNGSGNPSSTQIREEELEKQFHLGLKKEKRKGLGA